jgi:hypothetical protein
VLKSLIDKVHSVLWRNEFISKMGRRITPPAEERYEFLAYASIIALLQQEDTLKLLHRLMLVAVAIATFQVNVYPKAAFSVSGGKDPELPVVPG